MQQTPLIDFKLPPTVPTPLNPQFLQQAVQTFTKLFPNATPHEKAAFIAGWTLSALNILETIDAYACAISGTTPTPNGYDNARVSLEHYTGLTT